ncbi:MAG: metalloregulator ArsR/SmtB family transcription factor [Clostridiales bacterium]|nr:metalloregulator ArsR/SmtB family transcription factor [Clostridiales bacterium]
MDNLIIEENFNGKDEKSLLKIKNAMPSIDDLYDLSEFFKVFGDSTRINIVSALLNSELCVCDIAQLLEMGQSAISHQLRILKSAGLVKPRRDGKTIYYSLDDEHIKLIFDLGLEHILHRKGAPNE